MRIRSTGKEPDVIDSDDAVLTVGAFNEIKKMIIDLEFRPGELLMVQTLAQHLGVSRTPVREALIRLVVEGLVEHAEGRTIREIYDVREALECYSIADVAQKISLHQLDSLKLLMKSMQSALVAGEHDQFMTLDLRFHGEILVIHGNKSMIRIAEQMNDRVQRIRYLTISIEGRLEHTIEEHQAILGFLASKDSGGASAALKRHISEARRDLERLFSEGGTRIIGVPRVAKQ
jgi:DNA-binding GntR family transcriptional regulator